MTGFFVTGIGTEVGKTLVTSALAFQLLQAGKKVRAIKPVVSGYLENSGSDPARLLAGMGEAATVEAIDAIAPWRFHAPLSPYAASVKEGREVELPELVAYCREVEKTTELLLAEGAGGVMTPLNRDCTMLDWMAALAYRAILVSSNYLGALSHTLTAIDALHNGGVAIAGLVVSESRQPGAPMDDFIAELKQFTSEAISIITIPEITEARDPYRHVPSLVELCNRKKLSTL